MKLIYVFKDFLVSRACFVTLEITRMQFRVNRALRSVVLKQGIWQPNFSVVRADYVMRIKG